MDATYNHIENWNGTFSRNALNIQDYWKDYRPLSREVKIPVLFFYGEQDWMVGPEYYKTVKFPRISWVGTKGGHMPFMENKEELIQAITAFHSRYTL